MRKLLSLLTACAICLVGCASQEVQHAARRSVLDQVEHLIVIYQENWSFDGLYGKFPGANGLANAGDAVRQVDRDGEPYETLPQPWNSKLKAPDNRFPSNLSVAPFDMSPYVPADAMTGDLTHLFYTEQYQINGGWMDKFVAWSKAAGLVMGYYDATQLPEGRLAHEFTLADNFFHAAFGGSFLNHIWLVCACTPRWPNAPPDQVAKRDAKTGLLLDAAVTPDGYVVNTSFSVNQPHPAKMSDPNALVPQQTAATIGDRLSEKGVSWAWYSGGWNDAIAGNPDPSFQFHHQPFAYFSKYADQTMARADHLKDEQEFLKDLRSGTLPSVAFVKPIGIDNEHPGYATVLRGQQHVADLVAAVRESRYWSKTAIVIAYDENGGRWDHVPPPVVDRWGPGTRVPAIIVSPLARKGFVDHTQYDTTSILKTIETRWDLEPLGTRDAATTDFSNAFEFRDTPLVP